MAGVPARPASSSSSGESDASSLEAWPELHELGGDEDDDAGFGASTGAGAGAGAGGGGETTAADGDVDDDDDDDDDQVEVEQKEESDSSASHAVRYSHYLHQEQHQPPRGVVAAAVASIEKSLAHQAHGALARPRRASFSTSQSDSKDRAKELMRGGLRASPVSAQGSGYDGAAEEGASEPSRPASAFSL